MSQQALGAKPEVTLCAWCQLAPAVDRVVGTDACRSCIDGGPRERIAQALQRWERNWKRAKR